MIITKLKKQIRNPEKISVFIDGRFSLSVTYQDIIDQKLRVGLDVSKEQLAALKESAVKSKLKDVSLKWLLSRPRSIKEYQLYLKKKAVNASEVEHLTTFFINKGYLNQEKYARWLVQKKQKKSISKRHLSQELTRDGIDSDIINSLLEEQYNDQHESDNLQKLITKKRQLTRYKDDTRLIRYLIGKGFSYRDIKDVLDKLE